MRWAIAMMAAVVASCSEGPSAEKRYDIVASSGDADATCKAATEVMEAYLRDQNSERYKAWKINADGECAMARLRR